jgi:Flp pilus assembly protein TadD
MGKVLAHLDRHQEAIEKYRRAIELNPAEGLSHFELGSELLATHEEELAGKHFGEAARLLPGHVAARFNYGTWLMKHKRWAEAQAEFEAVMKLEPRNPRAQQKLAWLKEKTGQAP